MERSRRDRWLTGVCGGLGEYLGVDPVIARLVSIALVFAAGAGFIAYLAAFLLVPDEGSDRPIIRRGLRGGGDRSWVIAGVAILGIGAIAYEDVIDLGWGDNILAGPFLLGLGAYLLLSRTALGRSMGFDSGPRRHGPGGGGAPTEPADASASMAPTGPPQPAGGTAPTEALPPGLAAGYPPRPAAAIPAPARRARPPRATRAALGAVLVIVGLGGVLLATGLLDLATETFVGASVIVMGAALVAGAWWGGSPALIGIGFATASVLGVAMAVNVDLDGGIGDRIYRPASATTVKDRYRLGLGRLWVDLRATKLPQGTSRVTTSLGVGELTVVVPDDVQAEATGSAGIGSLLLLGRRSEGSDLERTVAGAAALPGSARRVLIDAEVGVGDVRVYRASDAPSPEERDRDRGGGTVSVPFATGRETTGGLLHVS